MEAIAKETEASPPPAKQTKEVPEDVVFIEKREARMQPIENDTRRISIRKPDYAGESEWRDRRGKLEKRRKEYVKLKAKKRDALRVEPAAPKSNAAFRVISLQVI